jgi:hypothetical protein
LKKLYTWLMWIFTLAGLGAVAGLLSTSASEKNRLLGSFSGMQLLAVLSTILLMSLFAWAAIQLRKDNPALVSILNGLESSPLALQGAILAALVLAGLLFGLDYFLPHRFTVYLTRLAPLLIWLGSISIVTLSFIVIRNLAHLEDRKRQRRFLAALCLLPVFALPGLVILTTRHGLFPGGNDAPTVKLAAYQFYLAFLAGFAVHVFLSFWRKRGQGRWFVNHKAIVLAFFVLIWLCAVLVWNQAPFQGSYNALGPFPPNKGFVPAADSIRFDLPGQAALVGMGFNGRGYVDNAFYGLFVMFLHLLAGQNFHQVIIMQILFLALIPGVIFLIAEQLGSPAAGVSAALLVIFREANVIRTANDQWMASVKVLLTEHFVTLLLCLVVYFLILWMKRSSRLLPLCLAGGLFGLSTMVRANPWFFLVVMGFMLAFVLWRKPFRMVFTGLLLGVFILAGILPWMVRCQKTIGTPFYMVYKYRHSVVEERYLNTPPPDDEQQTPGLRSPEEATPPAQPGETPGEDDGSVVGDIADHLLFSYLNTFFIFPGFDFLEGESQPVIFPNQLAASWQNSGLSNQLLFLLGWLIQLLVCSAGVVFAFRRRGLAGLAPVLLAIAYHAGNALALTSGSRYTQPVDWVFFLYFSVGALSLAGFDIPASDDDPVMLPNLDAPFIERGEWGTLPLAWILFFSLGLMLPLSDLIFPQKYPGPALETPLLRPLVEEYEDELQDYRQAGYTPYAGRLIYPMFYKKGTNKFYGPDSIQDRDRMIFWLVGSPDLPWDRQEFFLLLDKKHWPVEFLGGKDVLVVTCPGSEDNFNQAAALSMVIKNRSTILHSSQPCTQQ